MWANVLPTYVRPCPCPCRAALESTPALSGCNLLQFASHVAGCCRAIVVVVVVSFVGTAGRPCERGGGRVRAGQRAAAAVQVYFTFGFGHRKSLAASCGIALSFAACAHVQSGRVRACSITGSISSTAVICVRGRHSGWWGWGGEWGVAETGCSLAA